MQATVKPFLVLQVSEVSSSGQDKILACTSEESHERHSITADWVHALPIIVSCACHKSRTIDMPDRHSAVAIKRPIVSHCPTTEVLAPLSHCLHPGALTGMQLARWMLYRTADSPVPLLDRRCLHPGRTTEGTMQPDD